MKGGGGEEGCRQQHDRRKRERERESLPINNSTSLASGGELPMSCLMPQNRRCWWLGWGEGAGGGGRGEATRFDSERATADAKEVLELS